MDMEWEELVILWEVTEWAMEWEWEFQPLIQPFIDN